MTRNRSKKKVKSKKQFFGLPSSLKHLVGWLAASAVGLGTLGYSCYRDQQNRIPRLSVDVGSEQVYVGPGSGVVPPRQDNVVITVPIDVYNNSTVSALNLELNLLVSDGSGRQIDLNRELRKDGHGINQLGKLDSTKPWRLSLALSINPNAEQYKLGAFKCQIQVELTWEDLLGKTYSQATLAQLRYSKAVEHYPERFFFERVGSHSSYGGRTDRDWLRTHWLLPIQF